MLPTGEWALCQLLLSPLNPAAAPNVVAVGGAQSRGAAAAATGAATTLGEKEEKADGQGCAVLVRGTTTRLKEGTAWRRQSSVGKTSGGGA